MFVEPTGSHLIPQTLNTKNPRQARVFLYLAEREGFEPPEGLTLRLISSQVHSAGLCHLSVRDAHIKE